MKFNNQYGRWFFIAGIFAQLAGTTVFFLQERPSDWHTGFSRLSFLFWMMIVSFVCIEISLLITFIKNKKIVTHTLFTLNNIFMLLVATWLASMMAIIFPSLAMMIQIMNAS